LNLRGGTHVALIGMPERPAPDAIDPAQDEGDQEMTRIKLISAAAVIASAAFAAPAFAQEVYGPYVVPPYERGPVVYERSFNVPPGSYAPEDNEQFWNEVNHGFSGRDPSRTGGVSPNLKPAGN
jgi:hypothetical protein